MPSAGAGQSVAFSATLPLFWRAVAALLRVPLVYKLVGANVVILGAAAAVLAANAAAPTAGQLILTIGALSLACFVNILLVRMALLPIDELLALAVSVSEGNFSARAEQSPLADAEVSRLAATVNELLDMVAEERRQLKRLGAEVIYAQDSERSRISRELHDSIAQTLAAVRFQLVAAESAAGNTDLANRLATIRSMTGRAMDEVRNVSHALHPRMADDLGLPAALDALASQVLERSGIEVNMNLEVGRSPLPADVAATLFRVVQESLHGIEKAGRTSRANVLMVQDDRCVRVEVSSDGRAADARGRTLNYDSDSGRVSVREDGSCTSPLDSIRNRVALAGGTMKIGGTERGGMKVVAEIHLNGRGQ